MNKPKRKSLLKTVVIRNANKAAWSNSTIENYGRALVTICQNYLFVAHRSSVQDLLDRLQDLLSTTTRGRVAELTNETAMGYDTTLFPSEDIMLWVGRLREGILNVVNPSPLSNGIIDAVTAFTEGDRSFLSEAQHSEDREV